MPTNKKQTPKTLYEFKASMKDWEGLNPLLSNINGSKLDWETKTILRNEAIADYKKTRLEKIKDESNQEVFEAVMSLAGGDGYDGSFTAQGEVNMSLYQPELIQRLKNIGFLPEGYVG